MSQSRVPKPPTISYMSLSLRATVSGEPTIQRLSTRYSSVDILVGDVFGVLHEVDEGVCAEGEEGVEVVAPCPAEHAVECAFACFLVGVGDPDVADDAPFAAAWRSLACSCRALFDGVPVAGDIDGVEAEAHGDVAALADNLEGLGVGACAGYADGRVRLLEGAQEGSEAGIRVILGIGDVDVPELALVVEATVDVAPDAEDDFECLACAGVVLAFLEVDVEELVVGEQAAGADAEHVAALREVVEVCDAVCELDGVVEGEEVRAGAELDVLVRMSACAMSRSGAGTGSQGAVKCSPIHASLKPRLSASSRHSRSHWWASQVERSGG